MYMIIFLAYSFELVANTLFCLRRLCLETKDNINLFCFGGGESTDV